MFFLALVLSWDFSPPFLSPLCGADGFVLLLSWHSLLAAEHYPLFLQNNCWVTCVLLGTLLNNPIWKTFDCKKKWNRIYGGSPYHPIMYSFPNSLLGPYSMAGTVRFSFCYNNFWFWRKKIFDFSKVQQTKAICQLYSIVKKPFQPGWDQICFHVFPTQPST